MSDPVRSGYILHDGLDEVCPRARATPNAWIITAPGGTHHPAREDDDTGNLVPHRPLAPATSSTSRSTGSSRASH